MKERCFQSNTKRDSLTRLAWENCCTCIKMLLLHKNATFRTTCMMFLWQNVTSYRQLPYVRLVFQTELTSCHVDTMISSTVLYVYLYTSYSFKCIVRSNFRRKEPLYLFIQALFVSGTYTSFRDLLFSLLFPAKNISSTMMRQKVRWEVFRGRDHIFALLTKAASQGLMAWACCPGQSEVWRFTSTPPTLTSSSLCHTSGGGKSGPSSQWLEGGNAFVILPLPGSREPLWTLTYSSWCLRYFLLEIVKKTVNP